MSFFSSMIWIALSFLFFTVMVAVISAWKTRDDKLDTAEGYFLAGRGLPGIVIAGSLLLTNLSAEPVSYTHLRHSASMGQCGRTYGPRNHRSRTGNPHVCRVCRACRRRSDTRTADRQRHARRLGAGLGCTRAQSSPQHGGITYGIR